MSPTTLKEWLALLEQLHPKEIELGLERVGDVARRLGLLELSIPVVTVAGTNGKGSTVAVLEALLVADGKRPGVHTSPHFERFNERIRIGGTEVSDAALCSAFSLINEARAEISLSYFEFATLAALHCFQQGAVDVLVLEVGLGGRLDAVNIVDPSIAVITSIALDHQDWLGDSLAKIAMEKAGILRPGIPCIIGESQPPAELLQYCEKTASRCYLLGRDYKDTGLPGTGILPENAAAAGQAFELLGGTQLGEKLPQVLATLHCKGRQQALLIDGIHYLLDVAHNPAAVKRLAAYLQQNPVAGRTHALFAVMSDKDIRAMIRASHGVIDAWFLAQLVDIPRAKPAEDIAQLLAQEGVASTSISKNPRQALRRAQSIMQSGDRLVIFGSFLTVGAVFEPLRRDQEKAVGGSE